MRYGAGFYAYFCVLFEYGLEPQHIIGMDKHFVFSSPKVEKLYKNGYFLWCGFTQAQLDSYSVPDPQTGLSALTVNEVPNLVGSASLHIKGY